MASPENRRNWAELPRDILSLIFRKLGAFIVMWPAQAVCRPWRHLALDPQVWRCIDMRYPACPFKMPSDLEKFAREAVDRSGGHVEEFYAQDFESEELLGYITERSTGLRCLALISSYYVSDNVLAEFLSRCPLLEELQIINCTFFKAKTVGVIGRARPELKRFCLNRDWSRYSLEGNSEALEIADTMPSLRELQLIGNNISNEGLMAILDKCPLLESLDIRGCFDIILYGSLRAKLLRIRNVRLPDDSIADYDFTTLFIDECVGDGFLEFEEYYNDSDYDDNYDDDYNFRD